MSSDQHEIESTLRELKKSSQVSLTMVLLGALSLIGSLIYSGTRLAPLEEEIYEKSKQIKNLAKTEKDYLSKIESAKKEYSQLRENIEKLYAVKVTENNNVYELKATAKATGQTTSSGPGYNFSIFVNASEDTLSEIDKVTYVFDHPTFKNKTRVSNNSINGFSTKYYGWGCLTNVSVTVEKKDGNINQIDFNMCQSLGPQWWGENPNEVKVSKNASNSKNSSRIDCGIHWSNWEEYEGKIGNPCPSGCYLGEEVGKDYKQKYQVQKITPFGQAIKIPKKISRRQYQCWK